MSKTQEIILPRDWEVDKIKNDKIILKEVKKLELPKTWGECIKIDTAYEYVSTHSDICKFLTPTANNHNKNIVPAGLGKPMLALCQLLVCRDAYRNGWKPDWTDPDTNKWYIGNKAGKIVRCVSYSACTILSFQSEEVRDMFLQNFRDLIEEAKELI